MKILYPIIDGEVTGGNIIALWIIEELLERGGQAVVNSPSEGKLTDILRNKGIKVYNIDTRRSFNLGSAIKIARIIKEEDIDLVHSHTPLGGTVLSRLGGFISGVPVINHAHVRDSFNQYPFIGAYQFLLNWVTSRFFCSKVIAVSRAVKEEIVKQGVSADKIDVIHNGINPGLVSKDSNSDIKIRNEFGLKPGQRIIGQVGRLCENKGQHVLIKAAEMVAKEYDCVFLIIGEDLERAGEYKNSLRELARGFGLEQRVIFTGYRSDIRELMNAFDIFTLPSFVEGLPVVILEAMAIAKPVVATSVGGNPEIVIDGKTGTIVPPGDPEKLAEALIYHLKNPEISKAMGKRGHQRIEEDFLLSRMLTKIFDIYAHVKKGGK